MPDYSQVPWGPILFIAMEAMFFAALFAAYFYLRGRIPVWQPLFGEKPTWLGLPTVNTIELLVSGVTMQLAVQSIKRDDLVRVRALLIVTMLLGTAFILGQIYDFTHLGFLPTDSIFGGTFFLLTGFHGAHVTAVSCCSATAPSGRSKVSGARIAASGSRARAITGNSSALSGSLSSSRSTSSAKSALPDSVRRLASGDEGDGQVAVEVML